jgi:chloramphenicol 3-O phosphotransferase
MYAAVACSTEQSHCLDETPLDESILPAWSREFAGYQVTWTRLRAPLSVTEGVVKGDRRGI